jgi:hypothetical protein
MAKDPRERFETAGALAKALDDAARLQLLRETQDAGRTTLPDGTMNALVSGVQLSDASTAATPTPQTPPSARLVTAQTETPMVAGTAASSPRSSTTTSRGAQRRVAVIVVPLLAVAAVVAAVLVITRPGTTTAHKLSHASGSAALTQDVRRLNGIVELFIAGKHLSRSEQKYAAAAQNRQLVLARLGTLQLPAQLRPAAATIRRMTADSLAFNNDMARGATALARQPDAAHNALRPRFVAEFNPYARRYLGRTYTINDF